MPKKCSHLADKLALRFRSLESTRKKIERLARRGGLTQRAVLTMYEGLFLSAHVAAELFLEELFVGLLPKDKGVESSRNDVMPRVEITAHSIARDLITGPSRQYVDWVPFDKTISLAKLFFRGGRPFSDLAKPHQDILKKSHYIRNAIAHKSAHGMRQFNNHVVGTVPLPPGERLPAGYLRGLYRTKPAETRFTNLLSQLLLCARDLAR